MLDPTPNYTPSKKQMCPSCGIWFDPQLIDPVAEYCSEACAVTAQRFTSAGVWRRCRLCREEFLAIEKEWRMCPECYRARRNLPQAYA